MAHHGTIPSQLLKLVPRHEFEALARRFHKGRKLRSMTRWAQFVALVPGQLSGRCGLRDVVTSLAVTSFVGTSRNAVLAQLWIAMCVHLPLSFLKFANRIAWSLHEILRVLQLNLFDRRPIMDLLKPKPPDPPDRQPQLALKLA